MYKRQDQYDSYINTYLSNLQSLKEKFWEAQVSDIVDDYSLTLAQLFEQATEKVRLGKSDEFTQYMDKKLAAVVNDEFTVLRDDMADATLLEVSYAADFLAEAPTDEEAKSFPASSALLGIFADELLVVLNSRIAELTILATETISESGDSYLETDQIIETGFSLAGEFDESGFVGESERLVLHTVDKVNSILSSDIDGFKQEVLELHLDDQNAWDLQNQSNLYQELSTQFDGFSAYQSVVDQKLVDDRDQICESILVNASVGTCLLYTSPSPRD